MIPSTFNLSTSPTPFQIRNLESPLPIDTPLGFPESTSSFSFGEMAKPPESLAAMPSRLTPRYPMRPETPEFEMERNREGIQRAFGASRKLQEIVGLRDPEPFEKPPGPPGNLKILCVEGPGEYKTVNASPLTRNTSEQNDSRPSSTLSGPGASVGDPSLSPSALPGPPSAPAQNDSTDFFSRLFQNPPLPISSPQLVKCTRSLGLPTSIKQPHKPLDIYGLQALQVTSSDSGNTPGLARILPKWHREIKALYDSAASLRDMDMYIMLPCSATKPLKRLLTTVKLFDKKTERLGYVWECAVEEISYNEVDVFGLHIERNSAQFLPPMFGPHTEGNSAQFLPSMFGRSAKSHNFETHEAKHKEMRARALKGGRRWCWIYIRGFKGRTLEQTTDSSILNISSAPDLRVPMPIKTMVSHPNRRVSTLRQDAAYYGQLTAPVFIPPSGEVGRGVDIGPISAPPQKILDIACYRCEMAWKKCDKNWPCTNCTTHGYECREALHKGPQVVHRRNDGAQKITKAPEMQLEQSARILSQRPNSNPYHTALPPPQRPISFPHSNIPVYVPAQSAPLNQLQNIRGPAQPPTSNPYSQLPVARRAYVHPAGSVPVVEPYLIMAFPKSAITRENSHPGGGDWLHFEAAGSIPLIEGFRTDVRAWKPWLEAFGKGEASMVIHSQTEMESQME